MMNDISNIIKVMQKRLGDNMKGCVTNLKDSGQYSGTGTIYPMKKPWVLFTSEKHPPIIYKGKRFDTKEEGEKYLDGMVREWKSAGTGQDPRDFYSIEYDPKGVLN